MRFAGGTGVLIKALVKQIPADGVLINTSVKQIVLATKKITLTITQADGSEDMVVVDQVIAAIPPRLLAKISFEPAVDPATARRWRETATWMAPHAKFFAVYDRPFWRYAGLSGTALRFALNRTVVLRFRLHLESLGLAAGTVNQRLAAVRRLAYEAADSGLLSPELVTGIRRVKGAKQLDARQGKWLTQDQVRLLLEKADGDDLRSVRDVARDRRSTPPWIRWGTCWPCM